MHVQRLACGRIYLPFTSEASREARGGEASTCGGSAHYGRLRASAAWWRLPPWPGHKPTGNSPATFGTLLAACCQGRRADLRRGAARSTNGRDRRSRQIRARQPSRGRDTCQGLSQGIRTATPRSDLSGGRRRSTWCSPRFVSERVTVTATKTGAADIQTTPIAMTALPASTLEQLGVQTVEGLAGFVPTLTVSQHTGLAQVTIRGIGTNVVLAGADPSSTIHLDGVYLARPVDGVHGFSERRARRGPAGSARDALRAQLGRRHHQHRHAAADQRARDERAAHRR